MLFRSLHTLLSLLPPLSLSFVPSSRRICSPEQSVTARYLARRRRHGKPAPPICGPSESSRPGASNGVLRFSSPTVGRRHGGPPHLAGDRDASFASRRHSVPPETSSPSPSSSPRLPAPRRHLVVAGASLRPRLRRNPDDLATASPFSGEPR